MAIIYTAIFLTLFALFSNSLQKNYLHLMKTKPYSQFIFPKYVHHPRPNRISGLDLKAIVTGQGDGTTIREFFKNLIQIAYEGTEVYQVDLAEELLKLFQSQIVFDQSKIKGDEYHYVQNLDDLDNIPLPESLATIYPKLMRGSELEEDPSAGYPSLKTLLSIPISSGKSKINLTVAHPKLIETIFGEGFAQEIAHFKKEKLESYKTNDKPLDNELITMYGTYDIATNLRDLAMLRLPGNEDPTSDR